MSKRTRTAVTAGSVRDLLDALYAALPPLVCRGKCADSCGVIDMSDAERDRIAERGVSIPPRRDLLATLRVAGKLDCPALTALGTCRVYDVRPMICRLWGVAESMPCPHGCMPEGGWVSDDDCMELLFAADVIGAPSKSARREMLHARNVMRTAMTDPVSRELFARRMRGDRSVDGRLVQRLGRHRNDV